MLTPSAPLPPYDLQLLGDLCLRDLRTGERIGEPRRKPLAVLAVLVTEAPDTVEREALLPLLWPELDPPRARHALTQTLYALRQEFDGAEVVVGTTHLTVSPQLTSDLARWRARYRAEDRDGCRREYGGPLMDGMQVRAGAAFDRWVAEHRARIAAHHAALLTPVGELDRATTPPDEPWRATGDAALDPSSTVESGDVVPAAPPPLARRRLAAPGLVVASLALAASVFLIARDSAGSAQAVRAAQGPTEPPATLWQDMQRSREARLAARLAATDSTRIGRILLLSAKNVSRNPTLDSILPKLDYSLRATHEHEFAQPVPLPRTQQLEREAADWRLPVTTDMHIDRMLASTGAGVAVQPLLFAYADTLFVSFHVYRSYAHTAQARAGRPNVESYRLAGLTTLGFSDHDVRLRAASALGRFTRSLETCDPTRHRSADDAPWCWRTRTELDVVPGTAEGRLRDRSEKMRQRRAELAARAVAGR